MSFSKGSGICIGPFVLKTLEQVAFCFPEGGGRLTLVGQEIVCAEVVHYFCESL